MKPYKSIYKESTVTIKENKLYQIDLNKLYDTIINWSNLSLNQNEKEGLIELQYYVSSVLKINKDNFKSEIRNHLSKKVLVKFSKTKSGNGYDLKDFKNNVITYLPLNSMIIFDKFYLLKLRDKKDTRNKLMIKDKDKFESDFYNEFNIFLDEIPDEISYIDNKLVILKDTNYTKWINDYLKEM